jgi:hypothetical protein
MTANLTKNLNDILDVEADLIETEVTAISTAVIHSDNKQEDINDDYEFARENLYSVIEKGTEALDSLLELAKVSEHPRAFEVVATLSKTLMDANKDLLSIQKKVKELQREEEDSGSTNVAQNVTNALFVGSTAELQKMLKG